MYLYNTTEKGTDSTMPPPMPWGRFPGNKSLAEHDEFIRDFNSTSRRISIISAMVFGLVALGFLGAFALAVFHYSGTTPRRARMRAEALAMVYASNVHSDWNNPWVSCAGTDNDANGYVTCMISNRAGATEQIECADQSITDQTNNICRPYNSVNIITGN
jgi:hypothetical protein